jgi:hypothetical protein
MSDAINKKKHTEAAVNHAAMLLREAEADLKYATIDRDIAKRVLERAQEDYVKACLDLAHEKGVLLAHTRPKRARLQQD